MAINASKVVGGGKERVAQPNLDAGVYPARLVQVIDLGLQAQRPYQGQDKSPLNEILLTYELVDTFMKDDKGEDIEEKPRWVSETIPLHNLKADKAKSTQRYMALDPTVEFGGDFSKVVDIPVNLTLVNNVKGDKVYNNVAGLAAMRAKDAQKCDPLQNPTRIFDLDAPDIDVFNSLPDWTKEKIQGNLNYKGSKLEGLLGGKAPPNKEEEKDKPDDGDAPW